MRAAEFAAARPHPSNLDEVIDSLKQYFSSLSSPHTGPMKISSDTMRQYVQYFIDEMIKVAAKYKVEVDPRIPDPTQLGRYTIDKTLAKIADKPIDQSTLQYLPIRVLTMFMRGAMQLSDSEVSKIWKRFNDARATSSFKLANPVTASNSLGDETILDIWGPKGSNVLGKDRSQQSQSAVYLISRLIEMAAIRKMELEHLRDPADSPQRYQGSDSENTADTTISQSAMTPASILNQYEQLKRDQQILTNELKKMIDSAKDRDSVIASLSPMAAKTVLRNIIDMLSDATNRKLDDPLSVIAATIADANATERKGLIKSLNQRALIGSMQGQAKAKFGKAARATIDQSQDIDKDNAPT